MDARHVAAAHLPGADEFITTEKPGKAIYRNPHAPVVFLSARLRLQGSRERTPLNPKESIRVEWRSFAATNLTARGANPKWTNMVHFSPVSSLFSSENEPTWFIRGFHRVLLIPRGAVMQPAPSIL